MVSLCAIAALSFIGFIGSAQAETGAVQPVVGIDDYQRAERFLEWNRRKLVFNNELQHHWIAGSERLWYKREHEAGYEFVVADAAKGLKAAAFDHQKMAVALGQALNRELDPSQLPIEALLFDATGALPTVVSDGRKWSCDLQQLLCRGEPYPVADPAESVSPDGRYGLSVRDYDLWLKDLKTGEERALTTDGDKDRAYAIMSESSTSYVSTQRAGVTLPPSGVFSPDGEKYLSYVLDQSGVKPLYLVQDVPEDGSLRPILHEYRYPFPGDQEPLAELVIFDLKTGRKIMVDHVGIPATYVGPIALGRVHWAPNGEKAFLIHSSDSSRTLSLIEIDATTGKTRVLVSEDSDIYYLPSNTLLDPPIPRLLANGDFIWVSERNGYFHMYLHDGKTGKLKNAITSGDWMVRELVLVDETAGKVYFTALGTDKNSDPYYRVPHRVNLDGTGLERLTPEDADHEIRPLMFANNLGLYQSSGRDGAGFSSSGAYFVDSYAKPDQPTVTVIRDNGGRQVMELETAMLAGEIAQHYIPIEPFKAMAADGKTAIYGTIYKPSDFDPKASYPVIESIYPGPQMTRVSTRFMGDWFGDAQAMAELGFIVVLVDGRGTPLRPREFRAWSYGKMGTAGMLEDHVAAIRQIAGTRPYMDIARVGVLGTSAGGFAAVHALFDYPDFYKVGVSSSGNHDPRINISMWAETYHGPYDADSYATIPSYLNVADFTGKLLLAHGGMDDNVHPANTMRLADQLIRYNKNFDMLIMPNGNHGISQDPYFIKRQWDYFIVNLMGATPAADFVIKLPSQ